jgi:hypothetical protein
MHHAQIPETAAIPIPLAKFSSKHILHSPKTNTINGCASTPLPLPSACRMIFDPSLFTPLPNAKLFAKTSSPSSFLSSPQTASHTPSLHTQPQASLGDCYYSLFKIHLHKPLHMALTGLGTTRWLAWMRVRISLYLLNLHRRRSHTSQTAQSRMCLLQLWPAKA